MMTEMTLERLRAHRNNIHRYQRLLATHLSDVERAYIERRLAEERAGIEAVLQQALPDRLTARVGEAKRGPTTSLEMNALLHPADAFIHPMDVVDDCDLTAYEKRAILSSWAADACAVKDIAARFDDILDALRILDSARDPNADFSKGGASTPAGKSQETSPRLDC